MKTVWRRWLALPLALALSCLLALGGAWAADESADEDEGRWVKFYVEAAEWASQPVGTGFVSATRFDATDPFGTAVVEHHYSTEAKIRWRGGIELKKNLGGLYVSWYGVRHEDSQSEYAPGQFIFGEQLVQPLYAGVANDGLADGYDSTAKTALRELRVDFFRSAFSTARFRGKWFAGYRRVSYDTNHSAMYYAILPDFPPVIPPLGTPDPNLDPIPDQARSDIGYSGRGIEAGMLLTFPMLHDKLSLESEFAFGVLRGATMSDYRSLVSVYMLNGEVLDPADYFDAFNTVPGQITQATVVGGVQSQSGSAPSFVLDLSLELRYHVWHGLSLFGGFRAAHYSNVGRDYRPATEGLANAQPIAGAERSVGYEGFYGGLGWKF